MANRERGEVSFDANGRTYTLRMDLNALAEMETVLSVDGGRAMKFQDALQLAERGHLREIRALLYGGLRAHHPNMRLSDVGNLLAEAGGPSGIEQALRQAVQSSLPEPEPKVNGNPPKARKRGRGANSTSEPGASALTASSSGH